MRHFRGSRRRTIGPVLQSQKKVLNFLSAGFAAGSRDEVVIEGIDSVAAGQTSNTDPKIPTGSIVKYFEIHFVGANETALPCFVDCTIQYKLQGQTFPSPKAVGGSPLRNQVLHMDLFSIGPNQNSTHKFKFKIPKQFQRVRDGMKWAIVWDNTATITREIQVIYKYYR